MLAETFVDPSRFAGTCYRAANWIEVGATRGFAKSNATYTEHGQRKRILVYPLVAQARAILSRPMPHARLPRMQIKSLDLTDAQARALLDRLATLDEVRSPLGRRHSQRSVLALAVCAFISGARGKSNNQRYDIEDAAPSAFAIFFTQSPSFLDYQLRMQQQQGKNNVQSLSGVHQIPSDNQIRNLLDPITPQTLFPFMASIGDGLYRNGYLEPFRPVGLPDRLGRHGLFLL